VFFPWLTPRLSRHLEVKSPFGSGKSLQSIDLVPGNHFYFIDNDVHEVI
jgi:hypothetical protein